MKYKKEKIVPPDEDWPKDAYIIQTEDGEKELILKQVRDDDVYDYLTTTDYE